MDAADIILTLKAEANPVNVAGMARFGINPKNTLGISVPRMRQVAKLSGRNHGLAAELWASGIHEARIIASMVDVPSEVTSEQMEAWVRDFDSWDVCDQVCGNLFDKTPLAWNKAKDWALRDEEFVKRAGFVLMATLAVHDKKADHRAFLDFLPFIFEAASDSRNFVRKAVNWALRQIGKRNAELLEEANILAEKLAKRPEAAARWVGKDALREFAKRKAAGK